MAEIDKGAATTPEGNNYRWTLDDADNNGCSVTVTIGGLSQTSRPFPTVLDSSDATEVAANLAASLLVTIQSR